MSEELKGCPFCGCEPATGPGDWKRDGDAFGYVICEESTCVANPSVKVHGEFVRSGGLKNSNACIERAIAAWNRRAGDGE